MISQMRHQEDVTFIRTFIIGQPLKRAMFGASNQHKARKKNL
jgi:hypothetical protein